MEKPKQDAQLPAIALILLGSSSRLVPCRSLWFPLNPRWRGTYGAHDIGRLQLPVLQDPGWHRRRMALESATCLSCVLAVNEPDRGPSRVPALQSGSAHELNPEVTHGISASTKGGKPHINLGGNRDTRSSYGGRRMRHEDEWFA